MQPMPAWPGLLSQGLGVKSEEVEAPSQDYFRSAAPVRIGSRPSLFGGHVSGDFRLDVAEALQMRVEISP